MPSSLASAAMVASLRAKVKSVSVMVRVKCLPIFLLEATERDLHPHLDRLQVAFGGLKQFAAFACALGGQRRVAADDQPLAGEIGADDLGQVALVEQRQLQRPVIGEGLDGGGAQCGNPVEPAGYQ